MTEIGIHIGIPVSGWLYYKIEVVSVRGSLSKNLQILEWGNDMKTLASFLPILFLLVNCSESNEDGHWSLVRDQEDDITYYAIQFADENHGWIVGYQGTIMNTSNGGDSWQSQSSGLISNLWDISFVDKDMGWICGANGTLLKTENGGATWTTLLAGDTLDGIFVSVAFVDENFGWLSNNNGSILKTIDGGLSWELKKKHSSAGSRLAVFDALTQYHLHGRLYRTYDGGSNWDTVDVAYPDNYTGWVMHFPDKDHGFIPTMNGTGGMFITQYPVLMTDDAGQSWQESSYLETGGLRSVYFVDKNTGWVAGSNQVYSVSRQSNSDKIA